MFTTRIDMAVGRRATSFAMQLFWLFGICLHALGAVAAPPQKEYRAKLVEPLAFGEEFFEVTEAGTLRRRYRVWGDYEAEVQFWKNRATKAAAARKTPPRTFRLVCIFLEDVVIECPDLVGADGKPLRATFTTPSEFVEKMRTRVTQEYSDFTYAFTGGEVECRWSFETLRGLKWTAAGKKPAWSCQPRAIAEQIEPALAKYKDEKVDMFLYCAGRPKVDDGDKKQAVGGPPFGISYTQWQLYGGYSIVCCGPLLPLIVHEVNHRYLDNLDSIEGVKLTMFHGLNQMGYEGGDLGYDEQLAVYRSTYMHVIRPAMWRRFSLVGPPQAVPEPYAKKRYRWADVADDCWFRLPLLDEQKMAELTGLPSLKYVAESKTRQRQFTLDAADRARLRSTYVEKPSETDTEVNNLLSLAAESCAVLATDADTWFLVRPEAAELFAEKASSAGPLEAVGWLNDGIRPLLVFRGPGDLKLPKQEIGFFR